MSQYFIYDPNQKDDFKKVNFNLNNIKLVFETNSGLFSRNLIDRGTLLMLENISIDQKPKSILDMGCGYGVIGIYLKKIFPNASVDMVDCNQKAITQSIKNAKTNNVNVNLILSNFFEKIDNKKYDFIITNPPIRSGKENVFKLYDEIYKHLEKNGIFYVVVGQKQGAKSHYNKIDTIFDIINIVKKKGFYVIKAKKGE